MHDIDTLHRFVLERSCVRGELVHLDATWQSLQATTQYPDPVLDVLGEALSAVALLSATIKFDGSLILQMSGDGPLHLVVVQATGRRTLRGLARWRGAVGSGPLEQLTGNGHLAMTIDPGPGKERYQGIVGLEGDSLADILQVYFQNSEQLPTRLWLAADRKHTAGLLLQHLPGQDNDPDVWNRAVHLANTVTAEELLQLPAVEILRRLYHEEDVRLYRGQSLSFHCGCSRIRVGEMLRTLGRVELEDILAERTLVSVDCEFCGAAYAFDAVDVEMLLKDAPTPPMDTRHH
jgi:molecular chaperone Hsp33